jgi:hypothetical protein
MALEELKTFKGKIVLYVYFYVCVKFHGKFIIKCRIS